MIPYYMAVIIVSLLYFVVIWLRRKKMTKESAGMFQKWILTSFILAILVPVMIQYFMPLTILVMMGLLALVIGSQLPMSSILEPANESMQRNMSDGYEKVGTSEKQEDDVKVLCQEKEKSFSCDLGENEMMYIDNESDTGEELKSALSASEEPEIEQEPEPEIEIEPIPEEMETELEEEEEVSEEIKEETSEEEAVEELIEELETEEEPDTVES
ncbi:hypothetical protein, partial [Tindallia californiensis]